MARESRHICMHIGLSRFFPPLIVIACTSIAALGMSEHVQATGIKGAPIGQIKGFGNGEVASPHLFFISIGPAFADADIKKRRDVLPAWVAGAAYRIGLIGQDKYVDIVVELIASGEESTPKKVVWGRWLSGESIEHAISIPDMNSVTFVKWIDGRTAVLIGHHIGGSPTEDIKKTFRLTILDNETFDVSLLSPRSSD